MSRALKCRAGVPLTLPFKIGDIAYIIKNYHGSEMVRFGIVSEIYLLGDWLGKKDWEEDDAMIICATVKGYGRGIIGETVFATREEAQAALEEKTK